jgi:hypothetical protein
MVAPSPRSGLALWLACLITAVVVPPLIAPPVVTPEQPSATIDERAVSELSRRLDQLEHQIESVQLKAYEAPEPRPLRGDAQQLAFDVDASQPDTLDGFFDRLARLEKFENQRQEVLSQKALEQSQREAVELMAQVYRRKQAHATILDPNAGDLEKAHAWRGLREGDDLAWNDDVILEMTRVGAESENDCAREVVWIGADGRHTSPLMVEPLMRALNSDPIANVREEAADALGHYRDYPGVLAALRAAGDSDASPSVRKEALKALRRLLDG